jgi:hypothetical protein
VLARNLRRLNRDWEDAYGVPSLPPAQGSPARLLALVRAHWVLATLRNLAISLLRPAGAPFIAPAPRQAGWSGPATIFRLLGIDLQAAEAGR